MKLGTQLRSATMLLIFVAVAGAAAGGNQGTSHGLRERFTADEFRRAGLDKLTDDELAYLGTLVSRECSATKSTLPETAQSHSTTSGVDQLSLTEVDQSLSGEVRPTASAHDSKNELQGEGAFGLEEQIHRQVEKKHHIPTSIRSHVVGKFSGWDGDTVFRLENGQLWKQVDQTRFYIPPSRHAVRIEKGAMGTFFLCVEGYRASVKVQRLR